MAKLNNNLNIMVIFHIVQKNLSKNKIKNNIKRNEVQVPSLTGKKTRSIRLTIFIIIFINSIHTSMLFIF